jgi:hypothetical protein
MSENKSVINNMGDYDYALSLIVLKRLLKKDKSEDKPKKLFNKDGTPTKKAKIWNRNLIKQGKTFAYLEKNALYIPNKRVITNAFTDKGKLQKRLRNKYDFVDGTGIETSNRIVKSLKSPKPQNFIDNVFDNEQTLDNNWLLKEMTEGLSGDYRIIIVTRNKFGEQKTLIDKSFELGQNWWNKFGDAFRIQGVSPPRYIWSADSEGNPFPKGRDVSIIITKEKQLPKRFFQQSYLDGITHCLLTPIKDYFLERSENLKTKLAKKKAFNRLNKVFEYICDYKDGVPQHKIKDICDDLQIGIKLEQPFSNNIYYSYMSMKKPSKIFKLLNTRINHVDYLFDETKLPSLDNMYSDSVSIDVSQEELEKIYSNLGNESCVTQKNANGSISSIRTLDKHYTIKNDFYAIVQEFEKECGLSNVGFDALQYPNLMNFINYGTHFNGTIDFKDVSRWSNIGKNDAPPKGVCHIDQIKAYANFHKSKYYCGFVGKITDFRKINHKTYNGLYYIINIDFSNCNEKFIKLNQHLGWFYNDNVYTKAELDALENYGATFTITHGAYGLDFDFRFPNYMIDGFEENGEKKIKYYAKYCGLLASLQPFKNFYMKGNKQLLQTISQTKDLKIFENEYDDEHRIAFRKKYLYSKKHITAQITAYQRLSMLEQLMNMNFDKLIRVCVDGIYFENHDFKMNKEFDKKWDFTFKNQFCDHYLSNLYDNNDSFMELMKDNINKDIAEPRNFYKREFFAGAGGTGKTYYNLYVDKGLIHPIYIAPSWKLATDMKKEYKEKTGNDLKVNVIQRLLNDGAYPLIKCRSNNYIIDEASMINEGEKNRIFDIVEGKIIMIGDLDYQLKPIYIDSLSYSKLLLKEGKEYADNYKKQMTLKGFDNVQTYKTNRRFKCNKLIELTNYIRNNIANEINFNCLPHIKYITIDELKLLYRKEDMILRFQNEKKHKNLKINYTDLFSDIDKFKVTSNYSHYKNGEIVYCKPNNVTMIEKRHGFTTHSVQGLTFENNIFIDITGMKYNNRMIYTAISRARNISQLYIIRDV